jgi:hypothetical protein
VKASAGALKMVPQPIAKAGQQPLFPGNRGCGQRERGAAVVEMGGWSGHPQHGTERHVVIRIDGIKTKPKNRSRFTTKGGAMAEAAATRKIRFAVRARIRDVFGLEHGPIHIVGPGAPRPSRVVLTRLSFGELDRGAVWEAMKPVWDGVADGLGLRDDRELQKSGDVQQAKCKRGTSGVVIELLFSV